MFQSNIIHVSKLLSKVISVSVLCDVCIQYVVVKRELFDTCMYNNVSVYDMLVMNNKLVTVVFDQNTNQMLVQTWSNNKLIDTMIGHEYHKLINIIDTTLWTCSNYLHFDYDNPMVADIIVTNNHYYPTNLLICDNHLFLNYHNDVIYIYDINCNRVQHILTGYIAHIYKNHLITIHEHEFIIMYSISDIKQIYKIKVTSYIVDVYVHDDELYVLVENSNILTIIIYDWNITYEYKKKDYIFKKH